MKLALALCAALCLAACGTSTGVTLSQTAEKGDIAANDAYIAVATAVNAYETLPTTTAAQIASAEANIKVPAYKALLTERQVYDATKTVDLTALNGFLDQAKNLGH